MFTKIEPIVKQKFVFVILRKVERPISQPQLHCIASHP